MAAYLKMRVLYATDLKMKNKTNWGSEEKVDRDRAKRSGEQKWVE